MLCILINTLANADAAQHANNALLLTKSEELYL